MLKFVEIFYKKIFVGKILKKSFFSIKPHFARYIWRKNKNPLIKFIQCILLFYYLSSIFSKIKKNLFRENPNSNKFLSFEILLLNNGFAGMEGLRFRAGLIWISWVPKSPGAKFGEFDGFMDLCA